MHGVEIRSDLVAWARATARELLAPLPDRWLHVAAVGDRALKAGVSLLEPDARTLAVAGYLHDIGYAPSVPSIGFHPLDGARWLRAQGVQPRMCNLVAHHSAARYEAQELGLSLELAEFELEEGPVADLLVFLDMTTSPRGESVEFEQRLEDILRRHPEDDPVHRASVRARAALRDSVERSRELLRRAGIYPI